MTASNEFQIFKSITIARMDRLVHLLPHAVGDDSQFGPVAKRAQKARYMLVTALEHASDEPLDENHMAVLNDLGRNLDVMLNMAEVVLFNQGESTANFDESVLVTKIADYDVGRIGTLGRIVSGDVAELSGTDIAQIAHPLIGTDFFDVPGIFTRLKTIFLLIVRILALLGLVSFKFESKLAELLRIIDELLEFVGGGAVTGQTLGNCLEPIMVDGSSKSMFQGVPRNATYRFRLTQRSGRMLGKVEVRVNGVLKATLDQVGQTADVSGQATVELRLVTDDPNARATISVCILRAV